MGYIRTSVSQVGEALTRAARAVADDGLKAGGRSLFNTLIDKEVGVSINRLVKDNYITKGMGKQLRDAGLTQLNRANYRKAILGTTGVSGYKKMKILSNLAQNDPMATTGLAKVGIGYLATHAAFDISRRVVGSGTLLRDNKGRFDIAGIPFV